MKINSFYLTFSLFLLSEISQVFAQEDLLGINATFAALNESGADTEEMKKEFAKAGGNPLDGMGEEMEETKQIFINLGVSKGEKYINRSKFVNVTLDMILKGFDKNDELKQAIKEEGLGLDFLEVFAKKYKEKMMKKVPEKIHVNNIFDYLKQEFITSIQEETQKEIKKEIKEKQENEAINKEYSDEFFEEEQDLSEDKEIEDENPNGAMSEEPEHDLGKTEEIPTKKENKKEKMKGNTGKEAKTGKGKEELYQYEDKEIEYENPEHEMSEEPEHDLGKTEESKKEKMKGNTGKEAKTGKGKEEL